MTVESCIPVIPSTDLEKSLRFWVEGLGLTIDREMRQKGKLIGCMVHNSQHLYIWLNQRAGTTVKPENYEGIRLYLAPSDLQQGRERLRKLRYAVSDIVEMQSASAFLSPFFPLSYPSPSKRTRYKAN